jgi:Single domain von Willebrand factor type C
MKNYCIIVALTSMWLFAVFAYSPQKIRNTKFTNAAGKDVCIYEYLEIEKSTTIDQLGKCRELTCDEDFTIIVNDCFHDPSNRCHYEGGNYSLPYSECCGIRVCS